MRFLQNAADYPLEVYDLFSQLEHCSAYLSLLSTQFDSHMVAASMFHAGMTNGQKVLEIGRRRVPQGNQSEAYFAGSELFREVRTRNGCRPYRELHGSYGPASFGYTNQLMGNIENLVWVENTVKQADVRRLRVHQDWTMPELIQATGLDEQVLGAFNPHIMNRIDEDHFLYLPGDVASELPFIGVDETWWNSEVPEEVFLPLYGLRSEMGGREWTRQDTPRLQEYSQRFQDTDHHVGRVFSTVLDFIISDIETSSRLRIIDAYRNSVQVQQLADQAMQEVGLR
jgi:hypothetical protein